MDRFEFRGDGLGPGFARLLVVRLAVRLGPEMGKAACIGGLQLRKREEV